MSAPDVMPFANARLAWAVLKRQLPPPTVAQWANVVATLEVFFSDGATVQFQSAAPDLLAALKRVNAECDHASTCARCEKWATTDTACTCCMRDVEAALAKAVAK